MPLTFTAPIEEVPRLITPTLQSSDRKSALGLLSTTGRFPPLLTEERNWSPLIANMTTEQAAMPSVPELDVVIEVPRGSFLKRGSTGHVDFISPLPCPFNYGSVPSYVGLEGDLLDAVVLGRRLPLGDLVRVKAWGAVILTDRGMSDDKLICGEHAPTASQLRNVLWFFRFYARCKGLLNAWRGRPGRNACDGWCAARAALARARRRDDTWRGSPIEF